MSDPYDLAGLPSIRRQVSPTLGAGVEEMIDGFEKEEAKAASLFRQHDSSGNGELEADELKRMLDTLGMPLEDAQYTKYVNSMFLHCDSDGSGSISFREFMKLFRKVFVDKTRQKQHVKKASNKVMKAEVVEKQREIFFRFDLDNSGKIELEEFRTVMSQEYKVELDDDAWREVVHEIGVDQDGDSAITFDEWLHFARKFLIPEAGLKKLRKRVKKELTKHQEAHAWEKFYQYDKDGSGSLDRNELRAMLEEMELQLTDEQWEALIGSVIDKADAKNNSTDQLMDFEEFLYFYRKCLRGEGARRAWRDSVVNRYQQAEFDFCGDPAAMNYLVG